jgi:hypothetical protein
MKIYDSFTFYNEFDLLEIRLRELYDHVDHFVLVEADRTFQNRTKPFLYQENKERYAPWADKIIYVPVTDMPDGDNAWTREEHQRNAIMRGCTDAAPDDIIMVSDCDEIPRASAVERMRTSEQIVFGLRMPLFNFKFNYMRTTPGQYDIWGMAARRAVFNTYSPELLRSARFQFNHYGYAAVQDNFEVLEHAGWHFGYLGNKEYLVDKVQSFSHTEVNRPEFIEQIDIDASIRERKEWNRQQSNQYKIVELDDYFPKAVRDFTDFILPIPEAKVAQFLPQ